MDEGREGSAATATRFRAANERIEQKAVELGIEDPVPFLCECEAASCREILLLSVNAFRGIRSLPARFVLVPGHEGDGERVVERRDALLVVEKEGAAGRTPGADDA